MSKKLTDDELKELKRNALGVLSKLRYDIIMHYPFIGNVAMKLDLIPVRDIRCRTACTDGHSVYFDIAFLSELNDEERQFTLGHEVWHNVMLHFVRKQTRDADIFNIATDLEVNQILKKDGFKAPEGLCWPSKFNVPENLSAEEYYELLLKQFKKNNSSKKSGSDDNESSGKNENGSGNSSGKLSGQFDKHSYSGEESEDEKGEPFSDKYGEVGFDSDFKPYVSSDAADKMREAAVSAAQTVEKTRGVLPAHISAIISKLTKSEVNWREYLANFTTRCLGEKRMWCPPNRRHVWHDTYLQSRRGERVKIVVGIDTSGSTQNDIPKFLGELNSLVRTFSRYDLHLIQCDAEVAAYNQYDENNPLELESQEFKMSGGGGTTLHPIFDYIKDNGIDADCYIIFTDGYIEDFPKEDDPGKPVLWMISKNGTGEYIHFGEKVVFKED